MGRAGADGMAALADLSKGIVASQAESLALVGETLIDGTGKPAFFGVRAIRDPRRAHCCGRTAARQSRFPKNATVIDEHGKTILPGLWDMHAHFEQVEWGPIYLAAGVTTVRDCGNEFEFLTAVRDAITSGHGLGPRLLAAGVVDGTGPLSHRRGARGHSGAGPRVGRIAITTLDSSR